MKAWHWASQTIPVSYWDAQSLRPGKYIEWCSPTRIRYSMYCTIRSGQLRLTCGSSHIQKSLRDIMLYMMDLIFHLKNKILKSNILACIVVVH